MEEDRWALLGQEVEVDRETIMLPKIGLGHGAVVDLEKRRMTIPETNQEPEDLEVEVVHKEELNTKKRITIMAMIQDCPHKFSS